jgi:predicted acetyltransferase
LDGRARFDHMPIVCPYRFGNIMRKNVKVGFPADLVTLDLVAAFIFAVHYNVAKLKILNEHDGRGVIQNILQSLFACAKRLFCPPAFTTISR